MANIKNKTKQTNAIHLTLLEKQVIAEKSGYSVYTVDQILRGYVEENPRHRIVWDLYRKMDFLRKIHRENYLKDLKEL